MHEKNQQLIATERAEHLAKRQEQLARQQQRLAQEQQRLAQAQKEEAIRQRDTFDRNLYLACLRLCQHDWEQGQIGRLQDTLDATIPQPGRPDWRAWEWYYYLALCHSGRKVLHGHTDHILSVAWSPDGRRLASASRDRTVRIWDAATGQQVRTLAGFSSSVPAVAWSPDGKLLAVGGAVLKTWDAETGREVRNFAGHTKAITSAAWSHDGRRLASASEDRTVKVWDPATGKTLLTCRGPYGSGRLGRLEP